MPKISILMPAYNEGENLRKAVIETMKELKGLDYEIIIINDGSRDNTPKSQGNSASHLGTSN